MSEPSTPDRLIDWIALALAVAFYVIVFLVPLALLVLFVRWVWRW